MNTQTSGEVDTFNTNSVVVKLNGSGKENYYFADNCVFYIGDTKEHGSGAEKDGRRGHNLCEADKECKWQGIKIIMSEDTFAEKQEGHKQGLYGKKLYHKEDDSDTERGGNYI